MRARERENPRGGNVADKPYDYVIIGAGSAGCVLASRLTEDRDIRVLLIEAGGRDRHPLTRLPIAWVLCSLKPDFNWGYKTEPEQHLGGREVPLPRGKMLGGSSSINGMMYVRGHPRDYDQWRQMGLRGWGYADVLPYFKRSENNWRGETKYHGGSGPLEVRQLNAPEFLFEPMAEAAVAAGYKMAEDPNGADTEGFSRHDLTVTKSGRRASAARMYLYPALQRNNLTVITGALTLRIVAANGRATGVEYLRDGKRETAHASREVILSAGAYNSPQVLMLSGIGPADELGKHGIKSVLDLPGVGQNLSEHPFVPFGMKAASTDTFLQHLRLDRATLHAMRWALFGSGPFGFNGATGNLFVRTRPELERPDVQLIFNAAGQSARLWWPWHAKRQSYSFNSGISLLHPDGRGHVSLRSADPVDRPRIHLNLFSERNDIASAIGGIRIARDVFARQPLKGLVREEALPGADVQSDADLTAYIRKVATITHHPCGTCRMGTDAAAVVDETLKLRGLDGLRVVDASVMPTVPGGNINAPVIMIAEKAADMIRGRAPLPAVEL